MIESKLLNIENEFRNLVFNKKHFNQIGLLSGKSGMVMATLLLSKFFNNDKSLIGLTKKNIISCVNAINKGNCTYTFCDGIAGFGWLLNFLKKKEFLSEEEISFFDGLDEFLFQIMIKDLNQKNYDFMHGASGTCLYFLQNLSDNHVKYIKSYINLMEEISEKENDLYKWESIVEETGFKGYDLGISHGIPSIIAILSKILKSGINEKKVRHLLTGSINYLLKNIQEPSINQSYFLNTICENSTATKSRLAWCYGDLGVAISLYQASVALGNKELTDLSNEIFLFSSKRTDLKSELVKDAGFCHGSSGIAHIYNRMYNNTGNEIYKTTSDFWIKETLKHATFNDGLAGFKAFRSKELGGWRNEYNLLEGMSGICLSLLGSISSEYIDWDECLLLS